MNQAIIAGHLGDDPKAIGDTGASIRIATSEKGKDGQKRTEWHNIVAFGYLADKAFQLHKGDACMIVGRLETRKVQKQDGSTAYFTSIVANQLYGSPVANAAPAPLEDEHQSLGF